MVDNKIRTYIELNCIKKPAGEILEIAREKGSERKEVLSILNICLEKHRRTNKKILLIGFFSLILGIVVSTVMSNSADYEYFYTYGLVIIGLVMLPYGLHRNRSVKQALAKIDVIQTGR